MKVSIKKNPRHVPPVGTDGIFVWLSPHEYVYPGSKSSLSTCKIQPQEKYNQNNVNAS